MARYLGPYDDGLGGRWGGGEGVVMVQFSVKASLKLTLKFQRVSYEKSKKKVFFVFLLLFSLKVVSFIVIQYYNCFQRLIFIYLHQRLFHREIFIKHFIQKVISESGKNASADSHLSVFFSQLILFSLILCRCYQCLAIKPSVSKNR